MTTEKAPKVLSFNAWLQDIFAQTMSGASVNALSLAAQWSGKAGRLTRESVEKRAQVEYGMTPGVGTAVWDEYCRAVKRPIVAKTLKNGEVFPPVYAAPTPAVSAASSTAETSA